MNKKISYIMCILIGLISIVVLTLDFLNQSEIYYPNSYYQVYLDGEKLGLLDSEDELYSLINDEQVSIKQKYNINQVYPPKGFKIVKVNTYNDNLNTVEEVYNKIKDQKDFTIKGYTITIKTSPDVEPTYVYVLDQKIFTNSVESIVKTFIGEERFKQYMTNSQPEIVDTGYTIESMQFSDKITIKESYISTSENIFTEEKELTKYLLFGDDESIKEYTVVQGDTIETIAFANQLNPSELLIANENLKNEDTLLAIGQKINVALINPVLSLIYDEIVVEDVEEMYQTVYEEDNTKYTNYKSVKTKGENGINRVTSKVHYENGSQNSGIEFIGKPQVIKPVVNEVVVKGTKKQESWTGSYVDTGDKWGWPTNQPSIITSGFEYRWGTLHEGIDISGTGYGSPIYAALDGEVVAAGYGGMVGSSAGYNVVIKHDNGYYTVYAHMVPGSIKVSKGQRVVRGQVLGGMGHSGYALGTHLHFAVYNGIPYNGGKPFNPLKLWR